MHQLTVDRLCAAANCRDSEFNREFGSLDAYLVELQRRFDRQIVDHVVAVTSGTRPGLMRIQLATETFLSACLEHRDLHGWLVQARHRPALQDRLRSRNRGYALIFGAEMSALGWPDPAAAARLYMSMVNEAAVVEHRAGRMQPALREALWRLLRGPIGASRTA
ncbi:hypothetical protein E4T66_14505 [Sinimarinibacterium sp. CAU 1509]|uniref:hypothetical protein n=1 Tax=Sinimarinibacterium sp. CAU 1509 TaxID=2562283 RepID=UPI0010AB9691|nr:hypothetical protein [Sinimarinibacterium sp. CAU 1509]TJY58810.1 hypothetical protein E4T66_14505 [Sinimarinibacterium sp. CAU 1509]